MVEVGAPVIRYGVFIRAVFGFVIGSFEIFMVVKAMSAMRAKEEVSRRAGGTAGAFGKERLLTEIRDALRAR